MPSSNEPNTSVSVDDLERTIPPLRVEDVPPQSPPPHAVVERVERDFEKMRSVHADSITSPTDDESGMAGETSSPWYTKGADFVRQQQYRDALYCFSYVLQSDPRNKCALSAKGFCLLKMNRPEEAIKAFMQAARIDENSPRAQETKAALLRKMRASTWT